MQPVAIDSSLTVERDIAATRQRVWDVIADGWTYSQWVVGNSRMRAVDPHWPAAGSHHPPLHRRLAGRTQRRDRGRVLDADGRTRTAGQGPPVRQARITLRLCDTESGCSVEMAEVPVGAPLIWCPSAGTCRRHPRNRECTRRLAAIAERREQPQ